MRDGLETLTDREKETLRLLVGGHDAKSIAVHLGLSVHTVNERLRDARRKLGVSSSREAARLLAEAEHTAPQFLGDKNLGVVGDTDGVPSEHTGRMPYAGHRLVWFSGGMLIMSLIIAAAILSSVTHGGDASALGGTTAPAAGTSNDTSQPAGLTSARDWLSLLDQQHWNESWDKAAAVFQAGIPASQWATKAQSVRQPLGAVTARHFKSASEETSLPGAPTGQYEIIQFQTDFTRKAQAIETVVMSRDAVGWKVAGYFIR